MSVIIVVPKRKMLPMQEDTTQPQPMSMPAQVVIPPMNLSNLLIDTSKNWQDFAIDNLGVASDNEGAARKIDLDTAIEFIIDGSGTEIADGIAGNIRCPFAGTIISATLSAEKESGDIVIDIWKCAVGNLSGISDSDSITASAPPTLSSAQESIDAVLTGWTKTLALGDYLVFNVDSCTTITRVTLTLIVRRT